MLGFGDARANARIGRDDDRSGKRGSEIGDVPLNDIIGDAKLLPTSAQFVGIIRHPLNARWHGRCAASRRARDGLSRRQQWLRHLVLIAWQDEIGACHYRHAVSCGGSRALDVDWIAQRLGLEGIG